MEQRRSGSYKKAKARGYKTAGLSADQMKKATTLKGKKVSAGQMKKAGELKDISSTRWEKGKGVVGPGGKAFTGSVTLASGKTASYVKGRRIGVGPAKKAAPPKRTGGGGSGRTGGGGGGNTGGNGSRPKPALSMAERRALQKGRKNWKSGASRPATSTTSSTTSTNKPSPASASAPKKPRENETRTLMRKGQQVRQKYVDGSWRDLDAQGRVRRFGIFNW
jgi:hypothetical protein